jgi:two-component system sensor histidine kinase YesM
MVKRYFIAFTCIIAIPIFLAFVLFFQMFETTLVENLSKQSLEATKQVAQGIDEEAKRIALLTSALANNEEFLSLVYTYNLSTDSEEAYLASRRISEQLDTLFNYTNQVGAVFFFLKDKDMLYHRNFPISLDYHCKQEDWYQKVIEKRGKTHILQTFSLHKEENIGGVFIVCAICPGNEALKNGLEMIVLSFKSRVYSDILLRQNREDMGNILILSADNEVILDSDGIKDLYITFPDHPISDGSRTIENDQGKFLLISHLMPYMGMRIVKIFDYTTLTAGVKKYSLYARATLLVLVVLFFVYTGTFFRSIIRPLRKVILHMKNVGKGDMSVRVKAEGLAELNSLCETFNRMVEKIGQLTRQIELKERQRVQAEIEALQCQINPHFLSNTLNSIKMMASMVGAESIRKMTGALMNILTESFSQNGVIVPLETEVANLEHYIYIMKVRFGDSFDVTFDIREEIKNLHIMKMLIQPILENSIIHGVREIERKGWIKIIGWRQADLLYFEIADNGVGMSEATLRTIWNEQEHPHKGLNCIGIRNVHERIRLNYGDVYGLTIKSERDQGTSVTLVLPVIEGENNG